MNKPYQKGHELLCIKQMAHDEETYGIDFYENKKYKITGEDCDGLYIETESGSEIIMNIMEIQEYFIIS